MKWVCLLMADWFNEMTSIEFGMLKPKSSHVSAMFHHICLVEEERSCWRPAIYMRCDNKTQDHQEMVKTNKIIVPGAMSNGGLMNLGYHG